mmetsp:Transcript_69588/g.96645  ORF Transcript_69588/g.96645 Transcript_69588/m.96645 type:complete len:545 (-) Transcript_69588:57-1691(-)
MFLAMVELWQSSVFFCSEVEAKESGVIGHQTGSDLEEVSKSLSLSSERVDNILGVVSDGSLEEERKVGENWTHLLTVDLHTGEKFSEHNHIDHERHSKEGILTDVVRGDSVDTTHEDLRTVFIESSLGVTNERNVLDDHLMVDLVVTLGVKSRVSLDGIIENTTLGDLLGLEALVFGKILTVIVTQMVVRDNGSKSDTRADDEVTHGSLKAGLSTLKVGTGDETSVDASVLNNSGVESVLGRTIQVNNLLLDTSNGVKDGSGKRLVSGNSLLKIVNRSNLRQKIHFSVGSPEDDNLVALFLVLLNVFSKLINNFLVGTIENIVCSITLVGGNKVGVEGSGHGLNSRKIILKLLDESGLKNVGSLARFVKVSTVNIPTGNLEVDGFDHRKQFLNRLVDIIKCTILFVIFESSVAGGALGKGTVHVGLNLTVAAIPSDLLLVGDDTSGESGTVVTTKTDKHDTELGNVFVSLDLLLLGNSLEVSLVLSVDSESVVVRNSDFFFSVVADNTRLRLRGKLGRVGVLLNDFGLHCVYVLAEKKLFFIID